MLQERHLKQQVLVLQLRQPVLHLPLHQVPPYLFQPVLQLLEIQLTHQTL
jgi:hypothetical protein